MLESQRKTWQNLSGMECPVDSGSHVRDIYHRWDCGHIENEVMCDELRAIGFVIDESFTTVLEHHRRARNLPFSAFMKALKQGQSKREPINLPAPRRPSSSEAVKVMHAVTLRDIPISSSAKAPYGTDNNMYIRGVRLRGDEDLLTTSVISSVMPVVRKHYAPVSGAANLFQESVPDDTESVCSDTPSEVPRHLRCSINPISGAIYDSDDSDAGGRRSMCSSRRMSENYHSSILPTGDTDSPPPPDTASKSRKHFTPRDPVRQPLQWDPEVTSVADDAMDYARNLTTASILSHNPDRPPLAYRPISKPNSAKRSDACPFATDADDLAEMRKRILSSPLGHGA